MTDGDYDPEDSFTMKEPQRDAMRALFNRNSNDPELRDKYERLCPDEGLYYYFDAQERLGRRGINKLMRQEADRRGYELV